MAQSYPYVQRSGDNNLQSIDDVLCCILSAGKGGTVCVEHVLATMGHRSFGPSLLAASLLLVSPLSGVPGVSTSIGIIIAAIALQMLVGRETIWLPQAMLQRCLDRPRLERAISLIRPAVRVVDMLARPRLSFLTRQPYSRFIAALCMIIALFIPPLELVPFTSSVIAAVLATFALALTAHDGIIAIIAFAVALSGFSFGLSTFI